MRGFFSRPLRDLLDALSRVQPDRPLPGLAAAFLGLVVGWWVYVPLHELLHVGGCLATGGGVDRLEIGAEYGAALLQKVFPYVAVGSDYAGQLTGFDTHGNDLIYLATVYAPYLLTVVIGVPLILRLVRSGSRSYGSSALLGVAVPVAYAPFPSLIGDFYELGSIVVSRIAMIAAPGTDALRWRSDDLIKLSRELFFSGTFRPMDLVGVFLGLLLGIFAAFATYALGVYAAGGIGPPDDGR